MEMELQKSNRSQWALISGLLVLIVPVLFSLWTILKLGETLELRAKASSIRVHFDNLDQQITEWSGLAASGKVDLKTLEKKQALENKINLMFKTTGKEVNPDPAQIDNHNRMQLLWEDLRSGRLVNDSENVEKIDDFVNAIDEHEKAKIALHEPVIIRSTRDLVLGLTLIAITALLIILFALYVKRNEERNKSRMISELMRLQKEALAASELKSQFLATVSHEIRTPLNGIMGISDLLSQSLVSPKEKHYAQIMNQSGKTLLRIINDILDYSKIESGKFELELSKFSIADVVKQVVLTLSAKAQEKSLQLNYELDPELPQSVVGDSDRLAQVLYNLLGNAIKFTAKGQVSFQIRKLESGNILFSIQDTGVGISDAQIQNLFTPFYQVQKNGTIGEPGTGLGLSIAQNLVQVMGGSIRISSQVGAGSRFWFELPFQEHSMEKLGDVSSLPAEEKTEAAVFAKGKVLVVEDNPANQIVTQAMLERLSLEAVLVSNGQEALDMVSKGQSYDLILMDCQMPIMDGFEATRLIRNLNVTIPVVAMTANVSEKNQEECIEAGMNGFISKPLIFEDLTAALQKYLPKMDQASHFDPEVIKVLSQKIGGVASGRVIQAFLGTLSEFHREKQQPDLHRCRHLGHRFKSSAALLGAFYLAELCRRLETSPDQEAASDLLNQILSESNSVREQFASLH